MTTTIIFKVHPNHQHPLAATAFHDLLQRKLYRSLSQLYRLIFIFVSKFRNYIGVLWLTWRYVLMSNALYISNQISGIYWFFIKVF